MSWGCDITIGDHTWAVTDTDDPDYGPTDLSISWSLSDTLNHQPGPIDAKIGLVLESVADLAGIDRGTPVTIEVRVPADNHSYPAATYAGRVGDIVLQPRRRANGILASIDAVSYDADPAEDTITTARFGETTQSRIDGVLTAAGYPAATWTPAPAGAAMQLTGLAANSGLNLYDAITSWCAQTYRSSVFGFGDPTVPSHYVFLMADPDTPTIAAVPHQIVDNRFPGTLTEDGDLEFTPPEPGYYGPCVIDACHVELPASWRRSKLDAPNRVEIVAADGTIAAAETGQRPRVTTTLKTDLDDTFYPEHLTALARLYLPTVTGLAWTGDTFTYRIEDDDAAGTGTIPLILNAADAGQILATIVTIPHIPAHQNPTTTDPTADTSWYAGRLAGAKLSIDKGHATVDLTLDPDIPRPRNGGLDDALQWAWIPTGLTWADLHPSITWQSLRLAHN